MNKQTTWAVTVYADLEGLKEYAAYGRPNMTDSWVMFLARENGENFITAAFPSRNVLSVVAVTKGDRG